MSTRERKLRKRAGIKLVKPAKVPPRSRRSADDERRAFGLVSRAEIIAGIVMRG